MGGGPWLGKTAYGHRVSLEVASPADEENLPGFDDCHDEEDQSSRCSCSWDKHECPVDTGFSQRQQSKGCFQAGGDGRPAEKGRPFTVLPGSNQQDVTGPVTARRQSLNTCLY